MFMVLTQGAALQLFVNRLTSRSVLTDKEVAALLELKGEIRTVAAHVDLFPFGKQVSHSSLLIDGLVGRFGDNGKGGRQITCFHIPGDMADLVFGQSQGRVGVGCTHPDNDPECAS
jgi:hypothetical protein